MLALTLAGVLGFTLSALLYRKGPSALHSRLRGALPTERTAQLLEHSLGLEHAALVWLPALGLRLSRVLTTVVVAVLLDGIVIRAVGVLGALARALLRLIHNGDVQRALFFLVLATAALFFLWGRA
jgi:hypothetical protein